MIDTGKVADFVTECRFCDPHDTERVARLLAQAAELGDAMIAAQSSESSTTDSTACEQVRQLYNSICTGLPRARALSPERRRHIRNCFRQGYSVEDFGRAFKAVQNTPFLRGENSRGWHAAFDWIIKPENLLKVLEGSYGGTSQQQRQQPSFDLDAVMARALTETPTI